MPRLARRLAESRDTMLRTRILRALRGAQTAGIDVPVDKPKMRELAAETVAAVTRALGFRIAHARMLEESKATRTTAADLLQKLLRDKEIEGIERLFLVLGLLHPAERFTRIQRGLASANVKQRASSRELLENVVRPPLRDSVIALVDDGTDAERLARLGGERSEPTYEALVAAMIEQGGELGVLAAYHARELGIYDSVKNVALRIDASKTAFGAELSSRDVGAVAPLSSQVAL